MELSSRFQLLVSRDQLQISSQAERLFFSCKGTAILLKPGIIAGGPVTHECPLSRSIGYFLEPVVMIAPFSKKPLDLTLKGITTDDNDLSVSTNGRNLELRSRAH
jgi:RNA 3'-terminal phosphate cyclase